MTAADIGNNLTTVIVAAVVGATYVGYRLTGGRWPDRTDQEDETP